MKILVVGAGATGGYFGAALAQAGRDVTFLVRPGRAAVLRERGLRIRDSGTGEERRTTPALVTAAELRDPYDLVLVSVKATALAQTMDDIAPAVGPDTAILPILNGIGHIEQLNSRFGAASVRGGVALLATTLDPQGDIVRLGPQVKLTIGDQEGRRTPGVARDVELLSGAGFEVNASDTILADMWNKWVFITTAGAITCLLGGTIGEVVAVPGGAAWAQEVFTEISAVAEAAGFPLTGEQAAATQGTVTQPGSPFAPSFYRDMLAGQPIEVEHVFGDLSRRAAALSVPTPLLDLATRRLRVYGNRATDTSKAARTPA